MSKQVQIRRDTAANLAASTPAQGELGWDTTNKRLVGGDGTTAGGIWLPNFADVQGNTFQYAASSGTNTYTATLTPAPTIGAGFSAKIKFGNANTGSSTLNLNSTGAVTIQKATSSGLVNLDSGDIQANVVYDLNHTGSVYVLSNPSNAGGLVSVSQGDLNTTEGSVSASAPSTQFGAGYGTLPGGTYGFYPNSAVTTSGSYGCTTILGISHHPSGSTTYSKINRVAAVTLNSGGAAAKPYTAYQRYINSSPPFDMGDGPVQGFLFAKLDNEGRIINHYSASVPPWAYNGPTDIRAFKKDAEGNKYRRVMKKRTIEQIFDDPKAEPEWEYELITHRIKNADMELIPHPWDVENDSLDNIVLINPMCPCMARLIELQEAQEYEMFEEMLKWIVVDNDTLKRKGPRNIKQCKYTTRRPT